MKRLPSLLFVILVLASTSSPADEIDFIEDFALAEDRSVPLKQLIPGTEPYYYYHCLNLQNNQQYDQVDEMLTKWIDRHGNTRLADEIRYRQALLTYEQNPEKSLTFIRQELSLPLNHQRETPGSEPNLPTELDPKLISRETLRNDAFRRSKNLRYFEDSALDGLAAEKLNEVRRRDLLKRFQRPDHPKLVDLILLDLNTKRGRRFGSLPIHRQLLLSQLDELARRKSTLVNESQFVHIYLTKLRPADDVDWQHDAEAREAYLERLWAFAKDLAPVHNSLKANVLYHRLTHDRALGIYNKERFMTYLTFPRNMPYVEPKFLNARSNRNAKANLSTDYRKVTLLPPVVNDEPLVRSYLHHFFVNENSFQPYTDWIKDTYLRRQFAETKIVNGLGDPEEWYSKLSPEDYQKLKERIDLDFAATNKNVFDPDEPVSLDLYVKNVKSLIVKVYEINTQNYYRKSLRQISTAIQLDGLVANDEQTYEYQEPPLRRVRRHFDFPQCQGRGVYVIDFIGNGQSSRALIHKGKLRFLSRTSTAGQVFTVLDEQNRHLQGATLWLGGQEYTADEEGLIAVPFSNRPGAQSIVLSADGFSSLDTFTHEAEHYQFTAGIHVDRQSLLKGKKARVIVRPALFLNGIPVTLSVLEDVKLTLTSTDRDGVTSSKEITDFKLYEDRESSHEFTTPDRLLQMVFTVTAKVQNLSQGKKIDLSAQQNFTLNQIDGTDKIEDPHFATVDGNYVIDLLGKTGEQRASRPLQLTIKHRDFRNPAQISLQTDENGRVHLGQLVDIAAVTVRTPSGISRTWHIDQDRHSQYSAVHGEAGQTVQIPFMGSDDEAKSADISLLELRGATFVADRIEAATIENGMLRINNLPRGDYDLLLKKSGARIRLRLSDGQVRDNFVLSENRQLELRGARPLQISNIKVADDKITVALDNATKFSRLHVFASRYQPAYSSYAALSRVRDAEPAVVTVPKAESFYVVGRNIGDEYRYIIDRRYAEKFPGNMLQRPSLLLNPWAIRSTDSGKQDAQGGDEFSREGQERSSAVTRGGSSVSPPTGALVDFSNLDFLADASAVLVNLEPNEQGQLTIDRQLLGANQHLHFVACDPTSTAYRTLALAEVASPSRDLRLAGGLDPQRHFSQQKQITVIPPNGEFTLADVTTSRLEAYDNLARVYGLYATLSRDPKLLEFHFILQWHKLTPEEKRTHFSKHACHELAFFIAQKDPQFFNETIKPYLANKKDKTFLDHWLLGDDLSEYLRPWNHAQLNIVEQILLGRRIEAERTHAARHVRELYELIPPDPNRFNHLFNTALQGSALDDIRNFHFFVGIERGEGYNRISEFGWQGGRDGPSYGSAPTTTAAAPASRPTAGDFAAGAAPQPYAPQASPNDKPRSAPARAGKKAGAWKEKRRSELKEGVHEQAFSLESRSAAEPEEADADDDEFDPAAERPEMAVKDLPPEAYFDRDPGRRDQARQLFRKLDKTQEWVENNYYQVPIAQHNFNLVTANAFWNDYAARDAGQPFYSEHLAEASRSFTEMMFALSVLDLPAESPEHDSQVDENKLTIKSAGPIIAFHEEIRPVEDAQPSQTILVSQNFFRHDDRYRMEGNQRFDKYVTDEFLVHTLYGCRIVVTNPTSSPRQLSVLVQLPVGSLPVLNSHRTRSIPIVLNPYSTQTVEYSFYFPTAGKFSHYPVHVAQNEQLVAYAEPFTFNVVDEPSKIDRTSWAFISQNGTNDDVLAYLKANNLRRTNLNKIAFRMRDKAFFQTVTKLLTQRHAYNQTLWSYGLLHNDPTATNEFLQNSNAFVAKCGKSLVSPLLTIDPVVRRLYEHTEFKPLVNARAHTLGQRRKIVNNRLHAQYHRLLKILSYRRALSDDDLMAATYFLFTQDRVEEGIRFFQRVNPERLSSRLQYDYADAYVSLYLEDTKRARTIAGRYAEHPVDRWRNTFAAVTAQLDEIEGAATKIVDEENRDEQQATLAATQPSFAFDVESKKITLKYQNLNAATVNYYLMDIELLFSRNPFVQQVSGQFSYISPNQTVEVELPADKKNHTFELPAELHNRNVLVEITAAGQTKQQAYYSNSLNLQVIESYGQARVTDADQGKPIPKTYVKVYAQLNDGTTRFYKDGYTDLRGRFDYASLNTNEIDRVRKFSLLILSDEHGAVVREADPPQR